MALMTATKQETVQPHPGQPEPARPGWPLSAGLELGALPTAPGCGRTWTRVILWEWRLTRLADNVEVIAAELLTNALHASRWLDRCAIHLTLLSDRRQLVIEVRDFNSGAPAPRQAGADDEGGRGLVLVDAMSAGYGWYPSADGFPGKVVWAVVRLSGLREAARFEQATWLELRMLTLTGEIEGIRARETFVTGPYPLALKPRDSLKVVLLIPYEHEYSLMCVGPLAIYDSINRDSAIPAVAERAIIYSCLLRQGNRLTLPDNEVYRTIESGTPVADADIVGVSITNSAELASLFRLLDLAGIPRRSAERVPGRHPVVVGGNAGFTTVTTGIFKEHRGCQFPALSQTAGPALSRNHGAARRQREYFLWHPVKTLEGQCGKRLPACTLTTARWGQRCACSSSPRKPARQPPP